MNIIKITKRILLGTLLALILGQPHGLSGMLTRSKKRETWARLFEKDLPTDALSIIIRFLGVKNQNLVPIAFASKKCYRNIKQSLGSIPPTYGIITPQQIVFFLKKIDTCATKDELDEIEAYFEKGIIFLNKALSFFLDLTGCNVLNEYKACFARKYYDKRKITFEHPLRKLLSYLHKNQIKIACLHIDLSKTFLENITTRILKKMLQPHEANLKEIKYYNRDYSYRHSMILKALPQTLKKLIIKSSKVAFDHKFVEMLPKNLMFLSLDMDDALCLEEENGDIDFPLNSRDLGKSLREMKHLKEVWLRAKGSFYYVDGERNNIFNLLSLPNIQKLFLINIPLDFSSRNFPKSPQEEIPYTEITLQSIFHDAKRHNRNNKLELFYIETNEEVIKLNAEQFDDEKQCKDHLNKYFEEKILPLIPFMYPLRNITTLIELQIPICLRLNHREKLHRILIIANNAEEIKPATSWQNS